MNTWALRLESLARSEPVQQLGWLLVHSLWQFIVIAAMAWWLNSGLRRSSARARYWCLLACLTLMVAVTATTWWLMPPTRAAAAAMPSASIAPSRHVHVAPRAETLGSPAAPAEVSTPTKAAPLPAVPTPPRVRGWSDLGAELATALQPWLGAIVSAWCAGVLLCSIRPVWSWLNVRRLRRVGVAAADPSTLRLLERAAGRLKVTRRVELLMSTLVTSPAVIGCFKAVILLPASFIASVPASQLEAVLAHELAHVRRNDLFVNLLQTLIETLFFYHPAVWWLSRRIDVERENCCDDLVVTMMDNRLDYGRALVAVEQFRAERRSQLALSASGGSLLTRIRRLADDGPRDERRSAAAPALGLSMAGLGGLGVALICCLAPSAPGNAAAGNQHAGQADSWLKNSSPAVATPPIQKQRSIHLPEPVLVQQPVQLLKTLPDSLNVMAVGYDDTGLLWSVATRKEVTARRWDVNTAKQVSEVRLKIDKHANHYLSGELMLSPDCKRALAVVDGGVVIWDTATGQEVVRLTAPDRTMSRGLSCSADFKRVACGWLQLGARFSQDAGAVVWDVATGKVIRDVTHAGSVQIQCTALSSDGRWLATGGQTEGLCVWDVDTGKRQHQMLNQNFGKQHPNDEVTLDGTNQVLATQFSPDGKLVALADLLGVKLFDTATAKLVDEWDEPFRYGRCSLVFSPNGAMLARAGTDKRTLIWATATGALVGELASESHRCCFSPDSRRFAVGFTDKSAGIRVWALPQVAAKRP
ncbi:MAG: M48 family metalloprotease [Planctomycetales bacterium]|nr:M48 family metalloprotease [Planctomycetales bacterium]